MDSFHSDNIYLCLELFVDPAEMDRNKLSRILDDKKREWNQMRNRPDGLRYQLLVERWPSFKESVETEDLRRLAREAKNARLAELDRYISNVAGSTIAEKQIDAIVKRFDPFFSERTVRERITIPVGEAPEVALPPPPKPSEDSSLPVVAPPQLKKTTQLLQMLGFQTIYDALGAPRSSSLTSLQSAAERLSEEALKATNKTATISAKGELGGLAKSFFKSENDRKGFEKSWAEYRIDAELKELFGARCVDKSVSLELYERSVREALERGKTPEEADWLVYDFYVNKRKCPDPRRTAASPFAASTQCPECFHLNDQSAKRCERCGFVLRARCPKCGKENVGAAFCAQCGFSFGDAKIGLQKLGELKDALARNDVDRAKALYYDNRGYWDCVDGSKEAIDALRNRIAQIRLEEAEKLLRADRVDDARRIAENLSFDAVQTPVIDAYRRRLETLFQGARRVETFLLEIEALEAKRLYSTALERLAAFEKSAPDAPNGAVRSKRRETERVLEAARKELNAILAVDARAERERKLSDLVRRFPDFDEAQRSFASFAPAAPTRVDVRETPNGIEILWEGSRSPGAVRHRVTRVSKESGASSKEEKRVFPETSESRLLDESAEEFVPYLYSVVAVRGSAESSASTSRPVLRVGRVRDVEIDASNGRARFRWTSPPNVLGIDVERTRRGETKSALSIEKVGFDGFQDVGLTNGTEYEYSVSLRYRDVDGALRSTPKEFFVAVPAETAPGIVDLRCRFDAATRTIKASWTRAPRGETVFFITQTPPKSGIKTPFVFSRGLAALEKKTRASAIRPTNEIRSESKSAASFPASSDAAGLQYVWPVVLLGDRATIGPVARVVVAESVTNVRVQRVDQSVFISWDWPKGIDRVCALYNFSESVAPRWNDGASAKVVLTKAEYDREQAWKLVLASSDAAASVQIFPLLRVDGKETVGAGTPIFLKRRYIEYRLETPNDAREPSGGGFFGKLFAKKSRRPSVDATLAPAVRLKIRACDGRGPLPPILVVKRLGRPPMRRDDGVPVATIPAAEGPEAFWDALLPHLQPNAYCRCYLANVEDRLRFAILDPSEKEMKLFGERFR